MLAAVPVREAREDVWLSREGKRLADTPADAKVGTSSPRRRSMLLTVRPDLVITDIRGNVETRLQKLESGEYDALVMARAGLARLELTQHVTEVLPVDELVPAGGQGALAVQCRTGDDFVRGVASAIDHGETHRCLEVERHLLARLGAGGERDCGHR